MPPAKISKTAAGRAAERKVVDVLTARGLTVLGTNVRVGRDEIDIVARDGAVLVLVEVRARARDAMVHPLESVDTAKTRRLRRAALRYAAEQRAVEVRVDVAAVVDDEVEIIENAIDFTST